MEQFKRTFIKGITWRILGTISTVSLLIIMTGEITLAFQLGAVDVIIKFLLYRPMKDYGVGLSGEYVTSLTNLINTV